MKIDVVESAAEAFAAGPVLAANASGRVAVVGLGNTGSVAANLLARSHRVRSLCLIDFDSYEPKNLFGQMIRRCSIGRTKAQATGDEIAGLREDFEIRVLPMRVQDVPSRELATCAVVCGNLDSREGRRFLGELCWRLAMPFVDCGVSADGLLVRVNVIGGGPDSYCIQCNWSQADYDALEQVYACSGPETVTASTNAPLSLGALAASLQVTECEKLLGAPGGQSLAGHELLIDAAHNRQLVTALRRNPSCRFPHDCWGSEVNG